MSSLYTCIHCDKPIDRVKRGLCSACYSNRDIRRLYPRRVEPEPTWEEVEAMVEIQMRCLPDWWWDYEPEIDDA